MKAKQKLRCKIEVLPYAGIAVKGVGYYGNDDNRKDTCTWCGQG